MLAHLNRYETNLGQIMLQNFGDVGLLIIPVGPCLGSMALFLSGDDANLT